MNLEDHTIAAVWRRKGPEGRFPESYMWFNPQTDEVKALIENTDNGSRRIIISGGGSRLRSPPYTLTVTHQRAAGETSDLRLPEGKIRWLKAKVLMDVEFHEAGDLVDWLDEWLPLGYQGMLVRHAMLEVA